MTTLYLIRHSIKEKKYGIVENEDSAQIANEKIMLSYLGEQKAFELSQNPELQNIDEIWSSNYVRAMQTAKYICKTNKKNLNISSAFDERHYGIFKDITQKSKFRLRQFKEENLKNPDGESMIDVRNRMDKKINELLEKNNNNKIAVVCHNACIIFYILKYCKLENATLSKGLTISYNGKIIIKDNIIKSPSIIKMEFDGKKLVTLEYIEI